jgi:thymidylate kinase
MIVEFIGCDGAGKTTLSRMLCERGIPGSRVVAMPDLVRDRVGLRRITNRTAVNLVQDIGGFPSFVSGYRTHREYIAFARRMLARHEPSALHRINSLRGIVRRVGMYELATRRASDRIVLSDEGTVLSAYHLALTDVPFDSSELEEFARLVPRPDVIVYVRAPVASLVRRAASRPVRRRQHVGKARDQVERTIRRTTDVFDLLAAAPPLRDRVIVVENADRDPAQQQRLVDELAGRLPSWAADGVAGGRSFQLRPNAARDRNARKRTLAGKGDRLRPEPRR